MSTTMARVNKLVQRLDPGLADSVSGALALSNRVLLRVDSLAAQASQMTAENRDDVRTAVANLTQLTRQLNHLADEVSRRPYRLLTGVKPLTADSTRPTDPTNKRAAVSYLLLHADTWSPGGARHRRCEAARVEAARHPAARELLPERSSHRVPARP